MGNATKTRKICYIVLYGSIFIITTQIWSWLGKHHLSFLFFLPCLVVWLLGFFIFWLAGSSLNWMVVLLRRPLETTFFYFILCKVHFTKSESFLLPSFFCHSGGEKNKKKGKIIIHSLFSASSFFLFLSSNCTLYTTTWEHRCEMLVEPPWENAYKLERTQEHFVSFFSHSYFQLYLLSW